MNYSIHIGFYCVVLLLLCFLLLGDFTSSSSKKSIFSILKKFSKNSYLISLMVFMIVAFCLGYYVLGAYFFVGIVLLNLGVETLFLFTENDLKIEHKKIDSEVVPELF